MFDETIKHIWSVFGDQKLSTKEAEARLIKLFDYRCPDDFVKTMIKFKQRGLVKGENETGRPREGGGLHGKGRMGLVG